jgi:hypothetical protein
VVGAEERVGARAAAGVVDLDQDVGVAERVDGPPGAHEDVADGPVARRQVDDHAPGPALLPVIDRGGTGRERMEPDAVDQRARVPVEARVPEGQPVGAGRPRPGRRRGHVEGEHRHGRGGELRGGEHDLSVPRDRQLAVLRDRMPRGLEGQPVGPARLQAGDVLHDLPAFVRHEGGREVERHIPVRQGKRAGRRGPVELEGGLAGRGPAEERARDAADRGIVDDKGGERDPRGRVVGAVLGLEAAVDHMVPSGAGQDIPPPAAGEDVVAAAPADAVVAIVADERVVAGTARLVRAVRHGTGGRESGSPCGRRAGRGTGRGGGMARLAPGARGEPGRDGHPSRPRTGLRARRDGRGLRRKAGRGAFVWARLDFGPGPEGERSLGEATQPCNGLFATVFNLKLHELAL